MPAHLRKTMFGFLALATETPENLEPVQKVPHHDSPDPFRIAMVHYLCRDMPGGTGFFRHKATGFEGLMPAAVPIMSATPPLSWKLTAAN